MVRTNHKIRKNANHMIRMLRMIRKIANYLIRISRMIWLTANDMIREKSYDSHNCESTRESHSI